MDVIKGVWEEKWQWLLQKTRLILIQREERGKVWVKQWVLEVGIDTYSRNFERYKSNKSPEGRRVAFLNDNEYDIDRETCE